MQNYTQPTHFFPFLSYYYALEMGHWNIYLAGNVTLCLGQDSAQLLELFRVCLDLC